MYLFSATTLIIVAAEAAQPSIMLCTGTGEFKIYQYIVIIYNSTEYSELTNSQYQKEKRRLQIELLKLQEWTIDTNQRIAILLEGRDAAVKGSTIQRFIENLMPKATKIVELGVPNKKQEKN